MVVPDDVYDAAQNKDVDALRAYFAPGDRDPNDVCGNGWTLLDGVCVGTVEQGVEVDHDISCEAISFLLSQGASVDYQEPDGRRSGARMRLWRS